VERTIAAPEKSKRSSSSTVKRPTARKSVPTQSETQVGSEKPQSKRPAQRRRPRSPEDSMVELANRS
jgi:hypothetical protein